MIVKLISRYLRNGTTPLNKEGVMQHDYLNF